MRRGESLFEIGPSLQEKVEKGIETEGSNLSGVNSNCSWWEPGEKEKDNASYTDGCYGDDEDEDGEKSHISIIGKLPSIDSVSVEI